MSNKKERQKRLIEEETEKERYTPRVGNKDIEIQRKKKKWRVKETDKGRKKYRVKWRERVKERQRKKERKRERERDRERQKERER